MKMTLKGRLTNICIQILICDVWKLPLMCPQHTNCSCCAAFFVTMLLKTDMVCCLPPQVVPDGNKPSHRS